MMPRNSAVPKQDTSNAQTRRRVAVQTTASPVKQPEPEVRKHKMIVHCAGREYTLNFDSMSDYKRAKIQFTNRIAKGLPVEAQGHLFIGPMVVQLDV